MPDSVCRAYGVARLEFGADYLIPKPFDPRVLVWESSAVAQAAMETGVALEPVDIDEYREQLERRLGKAHEISRMMILKAQAKPRHVVFPEGDNEKILRASHSILEEKIATPILIGNPGNHSRQRSPTRLGSERRANRGSRHIAFSRKLHPGTLPVAAAAWCHAQRSANAHR